MYSGEIALAEKLTLHKVLYLPNFKYNLLSVSALLKDGKSEVMFHHEYCYLHDKRSKNVLAVGWPEGRLYKLDNSSFDRRIIETCFSVKCNNSNLPDIWHLRLRHMSTDSLLHIPTITLQSTDF